MHTKCTYNFTNQFHFKCLPCGPQCILRNNYERKRSCMFILRLLHFHNYTFCSAHLKQNPEVLVFTESHKWLLTFLGGTHNMAYITISSHLHSPHEQMMVAFSVWQRGDAEKTTLNKHSISVTSSFHIIGQTTLPLCCIIGLNRNASQYFFYSRK